MDLENSKPELTQAASSLEETQRSFAHHKDQYEKLRGDVAVKMQFLDENRVSLENTKSTIWSINFGYPTDKSDAQAAHIAAQCNCRLFFRQCHGIGEHVKAVQHKGKILLSVGSR